MNVIHNGIDSNIVSPNVDSDYLYDEWNIPRNAIKVGKMYSVTLTPAKSGKIATIVITDANSNT